MAARSWISRRILSAFTRLIREEVGTLASCRHHTMTTARITKEINKLLTGRCMASASFSRATTPQLHGNVCKEPAYRGSQLLFTSTPVVKKFATLAATEKDMLKRDLLYSNVLFKLEGLDEAILDNFSQFITSASTMLDLIVTKQFNLPTESFSQTLASPPDSYKGHKVTYSFKQHGRMLEVKELPTEKADTFVRYIQENTPAGVIVHIELKKWQDYVSPPDPRIEEERRIALRRKLELRQLKNQK